MNNTDTLNSIALSTFTELELADDLQADFLATLATLKGLGDNCLNKKLSEISAYDFDDQISELVDRSELKIRFNGQHKDLVLFIKTFGNKVYYFEPN